MFRDHKARGTAIGKKVQAIMDAGGLVTDDITNAMVKDRLGRPDVAPGFILDGYPRTAAQAQYLDQLLALAGALHHRAASPTRSARSSSSSASAGGAAARSAARSTT